MTALQMIVIALVQGISEFLPISSSGHLLLVPALTGWPDQGLLTDVMVHMGSFLAVLVYFWRDVVNMIRGLLDMARGRKSDWGRLALLILLATIPAVVVGKYLDHAGFMEWVRTKPQIVAWNAIIFGIILYLADHYGLMTRVLKDMTWKPAILIGIAQALAIIPGTSRSGITISAARALGFKRPDAARFAFLLGLPAIGGAGILKLSDAVKAGEPITSGQWITAGLTFLVALFTIAVLMRLIQKISFLPFAIYRVALGVTLLVMIWSGVQFGAVN